jgi:hypothetical protein
MAQAAPRLLTRDQLRWLDVLRADRDNIVAALRYWCDVEEAEEALRLAVSLSIMALLLGNDTDMAEWVRDALAVPGDAEPNLRTMAEALHVVTSALELSAPGVPREGGMGSAYPGLIDRIDTLDVREYPIAGLLRPVYAVFVKDEERMRRYLDEARESRDPWLAAASLMMAAGLADNQGDLAAVRPAAAEAAARFRVLGERWGLSATVQIIGNIRMLDGDMAGAAEAYNEASRLLGELGSREDVSQVKLRLAEIAARQGDVARARTLAGVARAAIEADGSIIDRGIAAAWSAAFEVGCGDTDAARPPQAEAERILAQFGPAHPARDHLAAMVASTAARIAIADGDLGAAREQAVRSYQEAVSADDMPLLATASGTAAELALALGQPERAAELLGASTAVRGTEDPTGPMTVQLAPKLRAALGDDRYESAYAAGKALGRAKAIERLDPAGL